MEENTVETPLFANRKAKRQGIFSNGFRAPTRPFNNRANTSKRKNVHSRKFNELKKKIYASLTSTTGRKTGL